MKISALEQYTLIETASYRLQLASAPETSYLLDRHSNRLFGFSASGSCNAVSQRDEVDEAGAWQLVQEGEVATLKCDMKSTVWSKKAFCVRCTEESLEFWHELEGQGALQDVRFFRTIFKGAEYGFTGDIDEVFSIAPNFREQHFFHPAETAIATYGCDYSLHSGCTALASTPHVFGLHDRRDKNYTVWAAFDRPGNYDWDDFIWNPEVQEAPTPYEGDCVLGGGFAVCYYGKKALRGAWESPKLCIVFGADEDGVLPNALEYACQREYLPRPAARHDGPAWWKEPIYCTWHDQVSLSQDTQVDLRKPREHHSDEFCTQAYVDKWLDLLEKNGCKPGTVILDDAWQKSMTSSEPMVSRWPDMRGWIEACHKRGIRVFLWCLAWHDRDVLPEEAVTRDGKPVCCDITNPKYEERLRKMIRGYFGSGPDGLNADGVKIDGLLNLPTGAGLKNYKDIWGLELQKYFLEVFYDETKKTKPDACVSVFTANPYLDAYTDMVRLADMYTWRIDTRRTMEWRAKVYQATHPGVLIDTDGQFHFSSIPDFVNLLEDQAKWGIPTTYDAEVVRYGRFFMNPVLKTLDVNDYAKMAQVFEEYRKTLRD